MDNFKGFINEVTRRTTGGGAMYTVTDPATDAAVAAAIVGFYSGVIITTTTTGNSQTLGTPADATAGRVFTVVNNDTSTNSFAVVGGGTFTITPGEAQSFIWDGSAWGPTDLGITAIPVIVSQGGTGLATITDHGIMLGSGTGAVTPMSVGTNGQLVKGVSGADPIWSTTTLTDGSNESTFTNGTGSLKFETGVSVINQDVTTDGNPQFATIELGNAADTTLSRTGAGDIAVEGNAIYRAGGTDVPVTDGGTGASTLTDHGILLGSGTDAITPMTALAAGEIVVGVGGADPHALAAGATTKILVGGGAADPVWTEATGSGAPVRATSPTLVTPVLGTPASGDLQNCTAATTTTKGVVKLPVLTNLLTNSQWMAMSGSTLVEAVSGAAPVTDGANAALVNNLLTNGGIDSVTTGWTAANGTIASVAGGKTGNCLEITRVSGDEQSATQSCAVVGGKLYQLSTYVKSGTSGDEAYKLLVYDSTNSAFVTPNVTSGTSSGSWVQNTIVFEAPIGCVLVIAYVVKNSATAGTMLFDSITLYEVTPGYVAADTTAPDEWSKGAQTLVYREHPTTNTKAGSFYALKVVANGADGYVYHNLNSNWQPISPWSGRIMTFGVWAKTSTPSSVKIRSVDVYTCSNYHTGSGNWEWLEIAIAASSTNQAGPLLSVASGDTAYFSQPMLVFGSSIGEGNYAPKPSEQILCDANIALTGYTATTSAADGIINLEAASSGMIGKGVKAVLVKAYGKDSAAGDGVGFDVQSASTVEDGISIDTQVNNIRVQGQGWVKTDANGDIYFDHRGSGSSSLTIDVKVIGVQT